MSQESGKRTMVKRRTREVLKGRVALVTGASSGIGWAVALGFADAGLI